MLILSSIYYRQLFNFQILCVTVEEFCSFEYIELLRRGYQISVGKYQEREVDFVATKQGVIEYYQVTYQMPLRNTREEDNLLALPDNYKKVIITANRMDVVI